MRSSVITPKRRGLVLVMTLIFLAAVAATSIIVFERTDSSARSTSRRVNDQEAIRVAEAGIEKAVWCLNNPSNTADCPSNPNFVGETAAFARGSYTTTVTGAGNARTIDSIGTLTGSGGTSEQHLQIRLTTSTTDVAFQYGVQTGIGGVELENNAYIDGNIYASGSVEGTNGSYINGDAILAPSDPDTDATSDPSISPLTTLTVGSSGASDDWLAQSFVPTLTERVFSLDLKLAKANSSTTTTVSAYIYSDSGNNPGSDLTGAQLISNPAIATSPSWENGWTTQVFNPSTNPVLVAGTKYWLVLRTSGVHATNNWRYVRSTSDTTYPNGTAKLDGDGTSMPAPAACASGCDIAFRINVGGIKPTLDLPEVHGDARANIMDGVTITKKAYYQNIVGTVKANLTDNCAENEAGPNCYDNSADFPAIDFPISSAQISQMEAQAALGGTTACSPTCTIATGSSIGPQKYDGKVILNGVVTLTGTVWVKGDLTINDTVVLSTGYGASSGTIVVHDPADNTKGKVTTASGAGFHDNGTADTYVMVVAMSTSLDVGSPAFLAGNDFCKATLHPNAACVAYVPNGMAVLSNNTDLREITAHTLYLKQNAFVKYETGLASVNFSSGPGGSWIYERGTYQIIE